MPREVHEHFDADGNLTGSTVITRESAWDEQTRTRVLELAAFEDSLCRCGCGVPMDVAHKEGPFKVDTFTCWADRAMRVKREYDEQQAKKDQLPDGWNWGRHYFVVPVDETEARRG